MHGVETLLAKFVKRYQVIIKGWPDNILFCNLSESSNSLSNLETLHQKWSCSGIYWKKLSSQELQELDLQRDHQIKHGEVEVPAPRRRCSNFGKKCSQSNTTGSSTQKKNKKSRKVIADAEDSKDESDGEGVRIQKKGHKSARRVTTTDISADEEETARKDHDDALAAPADTCSHPASANLPDVPTIPTAPDVPTVPTTPDVPTVPPTTPDVHTVPTATQPTPLQSDIDDTTGLPSASPAAITGSCT